MSAAAEEEDPGIDRERARLLLLQLAKSYPGGWDAMMVDAGVPSTTAHGWRSKWRTAKRKPSGPSVGHLLKILRVAGILTEDFLLPEAALQASSVAREMEGETQQRILRVRSQRQQGSGGLTG